MASKIAIVFGAGPKIGVHSVQTFRSKGFKVAAVSRSVKEEDSTKDVLYIPCDLAEPSGVTSVFEKVRSTWGEPSVILYNAFGMQITSPADTFSISLDVFTQHLAINTTSAFVAAQEALASFRSLPSTIPKTFLYTGNFLNEGPLPGFLTLGVGKNASAHMIELGDALYRDQNIRFFFVDERLADGSAILGEIHSQAHADIFLSLSERTAGDMPWQITFADGKYVEFPHKLILPTKKIEYPIPMLNEILEEAEKWYSK